MPSVPLQLQEPLSSLCSDGPLPSPLTQIRLAQIIWSGGMIHTSIVPDRQIIGILPSMTDLQIMIINYQGQELIQKSLAFELRQPIDALDMMPKRKDRLPACDRIGAYNWMDSFEDLADVLWSTALFTV